MKTIIYENNRQLNPKKTIAIPFHYLGDTSHIPYLLDGAGVLDCLGEYHLKRMEENGYIFIYILSGKMDLLYNGSRYILRKNDMALLDFRKYHEFYSQAKKDFCYFFVNIYTSPCITALYESLYEKAFAPVECSLPEETMAMLDRLLTVAKNHSPGNYAMAFSIVSTLISQLSSDLYMQGDFIKSKYTPGWCLEVSSYINENFTEKIRFQDLAQKQNMSPQLFSNSFKKAMGISPLDYLIETRLYHAKTLLQHTDKNLEIIAYETGFSNTSRFIKAFQKQNGVTPAQFRISLRKNTQRR